MSRHYSLDSIVVRGRRVFGWGFCLDEAGPVRVRSLRLPIQGGGTADVAAFPSGHRADLTAAFPDARSAGMSGFMVHGRLPADVARGEARLVLDPSGEVLPLPRFPEAYSPATDVPVHRGWSRLVAVARQRGWIAALRAGLSGLKRRARQSVQPDLRALAATVKGAIVLLDHGMGGGANRYRDERIAALRAQGSAVVLVHSDLSSLSYPVQAWAFGEGKAIEMRLEAQEAVLDFLAALQPRSIEINHFVGFEDVAGLIEGIVGMKARRPTLRLRFNLHDFHALCPAFTLIDASGRHCGVPSLDVCRACLPANARFALGMNSTIDVARWRLSWQRLLDVLDERVAFSRSSLDLLVRGLPAEAGAGWRIEPHEFDAEGSRRLEPCLDRPLNVVAVGHLNHAKGASLIADLAARAAERDLPLRFSVVGTLDGGDAQPSIRVTGAFARKDLCDLLEAERTGIALLPSICPETYSYVTDELMATGLPLAVLDLGAPAERVGRYHSGCLLPRDGLDAQLDALVAFGDTLRQRR